MTYDLIVLGGGPGGIAAAHAAAKQHKSVCLVEAADLGGTCLNWGCIPTKFFLGASQPATELGPLRKAKVVSGELTFHMDAIAKRKDRFIAASRKAAAARLEQAGVEVRHGHASFASPTSISVDDDTIDFNHCIVATGSRPGSFPGLSPDDDRVLDSDALTRLDERTSEAPGSLVILGGGVIGVEMAQYFSRLGTAVTIVEAMETLIPFEDSEVATEMAKILKRQKIKSLTGQRASSFVTVNGQAVLTLESGETITADYGLVATGRTPNTDQLRADAASITLNPRGFIEVGADFAAAPHIHAIGDVNGTELLAHAAEAQAEHVIRRLYSDNAPDYAPHLTPATIYGEPETMRVGHMVRDLTDTNSDATIATSRAPLVANPIAQAHGHTAGFVKCIWLSKHDGRGEHLVGVTAIGHGVHHFALPATLLVRARATTRDIHTLTFAHPTLEEALRDALLADKEVVGEK